MNKLISLVGLAFSMILFTAAPQAQAAVSPLAVGLVPPLQFPPQDFTVTGVRASLLYGRARYLYGLDFGVLGNVTDQAFVGTAVSGLFNLTNGMTKIVGVQFAGLTNINTQKTNIVGVQLTAGLNIQQAESSVAGLEIGLLANICPHTNIYGAQLGLYNEAQEVYGFQIGLVNVASSLHGVQLGLLNFNHTGTFAVSPILNIGF